MAAWSCACAPWAFFVRIPVNSVSHVFSSIYQLSVGHPTKSFIIHLPMYACLTSSHVAWRDAEKNRWRKFSVKLRDLHISDNTGSFFCFFETSAARIHTIQESVCTVEDDKEEVSLLASFNTLNIVDGYLVSFFASILHHPPELSSSSNSWMSMALSGGHNSQSPHATAHS